MFVAIGNDTAVEGYREEPGGPIVYAELEGQRVTELVIPDDGISIPDAVATVTATLGAHMTGKPVWIESDNETLRAYLCEFYKVPLTKTRPATWGAIKRTAPKKVTKKGAAKKAAPQPTAAEDGEE